MAIRNSKWGCQFGVYSKTKLQHLGFFFFFFCIHKQFLGVFCIRQLRMINEYGSGVKPIMFAFPNAAISGKQRAPIKAESAIL